MSGTLNTSASGGYLTEQPPKPAGHHVFLHALQKMVVALTELPGELVRPRWQATPPTQPPADVTWAAIGITQVEADEFPFIKHLGGMTLPGASGPGADLMQRHLTIRVLATFYGPEADDKAGMLRDALYVQLNYGPVFDLGLKLRTVDDLMRAPEVVNQGWLDRVDLRIEYRAQIDRYYAVLNLDGADVNIRHDDGTPDLPISVRPIP